MAQSLRWRLSDLDAFPDDDGNRYEIIDGELYVSEAPDWEHQEVCFSVGFGVRGWCDRTGLGIVNLGPGVIFADDDNVIPDLVWISQQRLAAALGDDRKLHAAPELVLEVLSPGVKNEQRDREAKLRLYARRGVQEYWIADWRLRQIAVYRRADATLHLVATLLEADVLESPLLPGFALPLRDVFARLPARGA